MGASALNQMYNFIIFVLNGIAIGLLFDFFRILRRSFKTPNFITYIEDVLFWILSGILTIFLIIIFNYGEIRLYILVAIILGVIAYMLTISSYFIKFNVTIVNFIKKIILIPIKFIYNIIKGFLSNVALNINKIRKKIKKDKKDDKNAIQKKDFTI